MKKDVILGRKTLDKLEAQYNEELKHPENSKAFLPYKEKFLELEVKFNTFSDEILALQKLLKAEPNDIANLYAIASKYRDSNRYDLAIQSYLNVIL
jgi:hypothetical protein